MTRYEEVANDMVNNYSMLAKWVIANNNKIPSRRLGTRYSIDSSAARELFMGVKAVKGKDECK